MAKEPLNIVSVFKPIGLLLALVTLYLCLIRSVNVASSIFRTLMVYAGFQILALLGYNLYLILARKAKLRMEEEERKRLEEIRNAADAAAEAMNAESSEENEAAVEGA